MVIVSFRLPEEVIEAIDAQAKLQKVSRSKFVRQVLDNYLKEQTDDNRSNEQPAQ